jgi:hypothetical protein
LPEWAIERGIGETRAALIEDGHIVEARVGLDGIARAGAIVPARLVSVGVNGRNAVARDDAGTEYLLPRGAPGTSEGGRITLEVTRELIPGIESWKRPLGRVAEETARVASEAPAARVLDFPSPRDELAAAGWHDVIEEARSGLVEFAGGELRISPTPAMTLIDVDGLLPPEELAVAGAAQAASAIRRLDIGGSIGIDLPTTGSKVARQAAAAAIDERLPQPFERTAVNGFGFVQIVRPRARASLVELAQDRAAFEARVLLRRAALEAPGAKCLVANPAIVAALQSRPDWIEALAAQVGGAISLRADPRLPMSGAYAENP